MALTVPDVAVKFDQKDDIDQMLQLWNKLTVRGQSEALDNSSYSIDFKLVRINESRSKYSLDRCKILASTVRNSSTTNWSKIHPQPSLLQSSQDLHSQALK